MNDPDRNSRAAFAVAAAITIAAVAAVVLLVALRHDGGRAATRGGRVPLPGFGETQVRVEAPNRTLEWCLLLAATEAQRERGLMEVTDPSLGGYDGMLFRFDADTNVRFYMRNTPMPLSIAFIAADGHVVSTADMAPCEDRDGCPLYAAAGPYRIAIEVPQGGLTRLGITPDATVVDEATGCSAP